MVQSSAEPLQQSPAGTGEVADSISATCLHHAREVGREFVYIYYMCVNKCPHDLHRFYSGASYFVHGGRELPGQPADAPVGGQKAIASKIAALDFRDCRTKILMVDSLPAPANGVLIQVCGEISNNAGPMRRFMQTFLLAPIAAKKYFVQNDIFRFQDEVFTDADGATAGEDADAHAEASVEVPIGDNNGNGNGEDNHQGGCETDVEAPQAQAATAADDGGCGDDVAVYVAEDISGGGGGEVGYDEENGMEIADNGHGDAVAALAEMETAAGAEDATAAFEEPTAAALEEAPVAAASDVASAGQQQQPPPPLTASAAGGKKNFAALFVGPGPAQPLQMRRQQPQPAAVQTNGNHTTTAPAAVPAAVAPTESGQATPAAPAAPRAPEAADNLQVFVGNLAADVHEAELTELFSQFGEVTACRITIGKPRPGQNSAPNFGFVSFANAHSVKAAVSKPPTMNGARINVEEKKPGFRRGGGGRGGYGGGGYGGDGSGYGGGYGGGGGGRGGYGGGRGGGGGGYGGQHPRR